MLWVPDKNRPICPQIYECICVGIANGYYKPNERIPSVREIAVEAGVNPNTVQKALAMLEENGLVYSVRGSGIFVGDNINYATNKLEQIKKTKVIAFFDEMKSLGLNDGDIKDAIEKYISEKEMIK